MSVVIAVVLELRPILSLEFFGGLFFFFFLLRTISIVMINSFPRGLLPSLVVQGLHALSSAMSVVVAALLELSAILAC